MTPFFEKWQAAKGAFVPRHARDADRADQRRTRQQRIEADAAHRVHQLRRLLCRLRHRALERGLSGPGGAQSRLDAGQRRRATAATRAARAPSRPTAAVTTATRTSPASSIAQRRSTRPPSIAGLKRRTIAGLSARRDRAGEGDERPPLSLQRVTAALMVPLILVHLAVIFYATRSGLTAADILARTRGSVVWALNYGAVRAGGVGAWRHRRARRSRPSGRGCGARCWTR